MHASVSAKTAETAEMDDLRSSAALAEALPHSPVEAGAALCGHLVLLENGGAVRVRNVVEQQTVG
jgi:hypothetical protein